MAVTDIASRPTTMAGGSTRIVRSPFRYRLLQAADAADDPGILSGSAGHLFGDQSQQDVRLAEIIDEGELRAQLDHARSIRFTKKELIWLAGNTFYGKTQMFSPEFINWLSTFRLPEYELNKVDGQYELHFHGPSHTTM